MKKKYISLALVAFGAPILVNPAQAQQDELLGLQIDAALEARSVDNAGQQPDSVEQVRETQTTGSLSTIGQMEGRWADFATNYRLEDRRYSKFSEEDERVVLGDSQLTLGPQHRRSYLQLSHSSREVSINPLAGDVPANRDNRQIYSALLYGSVSPGRGNNLALSLGATDIQFDENNANEAERFSAGLTFDRALSAVTRAGVALSGYDLNYKNVEDSDVTYSRLAAIWRTQLRQLEYGFEIGGNRIENDVDSTTSPSIAADLSYRSGPQTLSVTYNQYLSDTAQGGQETSNFNQTVEVDGRVDDVIDQFKLQQFALTWTHTQICSVCALQIDLGVDRESYLVYTNYDSREARASTRFTYQASPYVTLLLRGEFLDFEEINAEPQDGYLQTLFDFTVSFPRIIRDGQLDIFAGYVERDLELSEGYDYNYVGARFRYRLFER